MGGAETALLMPQTPSSLGEGGLRGYLARWVGERHGQDGSPLKLGLLVLKQQPPTPPKPLSPGSTPSLPGSARTAGQATRGWGSSAAAPLRAPAAQDREEPPRLGPPRAGAVRGPKLTGQEADPQQQQQRPQRPRDSELHGAPSGL